MFQNTGVNVPPQGKVNVDAHKGSTADVYLRQDAAGNDFLAIVLEGVSERFQMNVLQVLARRTSVRVAVDGLGIVDPIAYVISASQARHLAEQITELLGSAC